MAIPLHIILDEVASTNDFAAFYLSKTKPPEGSAISADNQVKGRGQVGRSWLSEPKKNVQLSVILYPTRLLIANQFFLNIILSLALYDLVKHYCPNQSVTIKWPNDIYINDKKVAGLLIQLSIAGNRIQNAVLGVGLNVFQQKFPSVLPNATSLSLHQKQLPALEKFPELIQKGITHYYKKLYAGKADQLKAIYEAKLYRNKQLCSFTTPEGAFFEGSILGVDDQGHLIILINGARKKFNLSELRMVI